MKVFWIGILCLVVASVLLVIIQSPSEQSHLTEQDNSPDVRLAPQGKQNSTPQVVRSPDGQGDDSSVGHEHEPGSSPSRVDNQALLEKPNASGDDVVSLQDAPQSGDEHMTDDASPSEIVMPLDEEGRVVLNDRYAIVGKGSIDDPYQINWPLLMSAVSSYKPKDNSEQVPAWLTFLDGSMVEISGFIFLPIIQSETSEVLLMLNQWDGCCVGVPPTPYDSVEVVLGQPVNLSQSSVAYATARGRLQVDPYVKKGWLIGLYVLEEGRLLLPDL